MFPALPRGGTGLSGPIGRTIGLDLNLRLTHHSCNSSADNNAGVRKTEIENKIMHVWVCGNELH